MPSTGPHDIRLAIVGAPGTGRTSLATKLNNLTFRRLEDSASFRFIVSECEVPISQASHIQDIQGVLVTFDLSIPSNGPYMRARGLIRELRDGHLRSKLTCVVGTKLDLVPDDYSEFGLWARRLPLQCACEDIDLFKVGNPTGAGLSECCQWIAHQMYPPQATRTLPTFSIFTDLATRALDIIAYLFSLPLPERSNEPKPDLTELDDAKVDILVKSPRALEWDRALIKYATLIPSSPTHRISDTLIAKYKAESEYQSMIFVRSHTTIPVPAPRFGDKLSCWLVMDFIDGEMLTACWEKQSLFMKFRIACTLRGYISQLRRLSSAVPGSLADGMIHGPLFDEDEWGPFDSSKKFRLWCELVAHTGWEYRVRQLDDTAKPKKIPPLPPRGGSWPLVFTHNDLSLSNIILSKDGTLWLVDWAESGFYPPSVESLGIKYYSDAPESWQRFRWLIAGTCPQDELFWDYFSSDVHRFR